MSKSFTEKLIEFTKDSESPTSFWKWSSYAILGAAMRDNVYWDQMGEKICPNIYVLLNSDSATHRKGNGPKMAMRLLEPLKHTKVIRGRGSIQAILEDLANVTTDRQTGKSMRGGSCLLVADELKSFFVDDGALVGIMTDVYEYKESFSYKLRQNSFTVKGLCLSMLAASNDEFLKSIFTGEAVYGGLLGRTFLVKPDEYRPANSLLKTDEEKEEEATRYDPTELITLLKEVTKLKGEVKFEMAAKIAYDNWYIPLRKSYEHKPDRTGVIQRLHTGVIKMSVILAVSRRLELIVRKVDMNDAIDECIALMPNYDTFAMSRGQSDDSVAGSYLMNDMWMRGGSITRAEFLREHWYDVSADLLDKVTVTLEQAGFIQQSFPNGATGWTLTPMCKEIFQKKVN